MSQFSRVKKNQELYEEINKEDKTKIIESSLRDFERRTTDPHSEESMYQASRYRKYQELAKDTELEESSEISEQTESLDNLNEEEKLSKSEKDHENLSKKDILRDRDLLEEFIEEVKHYNINRGLRNVQDTQMNILQNLGKSRQETEEIPEETIEDLQYSQKVETSEEKLENKEEVNNQSDQELTQEIQSIIFDLDNDDDDYNDDTEEEDNFTFTPLDREEDVTLTNIFKEIEDNTDKQKHTKEHTKDLKPEVDENVADKAVFVANEKEEITKKDKDILEEKINNIETDNKKDLKQDTTKNYNKRDYKSSELLELTQTLNLKLDLQEQELDEVSEKVSVLDRILSVFMFFLVVALVGVIIFGVFWLAKERGLF